LISENVTSGNRRFQPKFRKAKDSSRRGAGARDAIKRRFWIGRPAYTYAGLRAPGVLWHNDAA
jgi:hypothetical protein